MIRQSKFADERRECGPMECWCLHGAVGHVADWRDFAKRLAGLSTGSRAVDLWRFLDCGPMSLEQFGAALNAEAAGEVSRGVSRALLGYSMGGRLALHALLAGAHPWSAAVIVSAHPGLEDDSERESRRSADAAWAARAFGADWPDFLAAWNGQEIFGQTEIREPAANRALAQRRREIARCFIDWSLGAQQSLWPRLAEIRIPVLWVAGEHDAKFRALAERAVAMLPHGRLAIVPEAGHRVPWQAPDRLAAEVAAFLRVGA